MNDSGGKRILFNKSSLINLKAELLKKQEQVKLMKCLPQHKIENYKPPPPKPSDKSDDEPSTKKTLKDSLQGVDTDALEEYKKSKSALEKKAQLYEHLSNPVGESKLASNFLVDFAAKKQAAEPTSDKPDDTNKFEDDDDSEWTEFTDCLGRTRKCLKVDLDLFKAKDEQLQRPKENSANYYSEALESRQKEMPFLVQKTNDYLQSLREKWEEKEKELLAKDKDIHYQDVLFDEARMHGASYYSFSTNEVERQKQMEELLKIREQTLRAQKEAEEKRRQRDDLVATRLKAAKARQRLRAGLPPEDPEENQKDFNACLMEFLNKQKEEADARALENERQIKEQIEKERQKLREAYVRDWDRGKEGVSDTPKFKEMSQEEYVEQQRAKRIDEFAPVPSSSTGNKKSTRSFDESGNITDDSKPKTWADVRPNVKHSEADVIFNEDSKGLYFTTARKTNKPSSETNSLVLNRETKPKTPPPPIIGDTDEYKDHSSYFNKNSMKYKNYFVKETQEPTPIINELSDEDDSSDVRHRSTLQSNHSEIAPPPTYDYYGPTPKKARTQIPFASDIREAYAQGQKSLETKSGNHRVTKDYDFTFV